MKKILFVIATASLLIVACKKEKGCTDKTATNYSSTAEEDDGSCTYAEVVDTTTSGGTNTGGTTDTTGNTGGTNTGGTGTTVPVYGNGVTDIDGNTYKSVIIGSQEWMAENLNTNKYNDGTDIRLIVDSEAWEKDSLGAYTYYDNDRAKYESSFGALYNWQAVKTGKLCPTGWHVPNGADWRNLVDYIKNNGFKDEVGLVLKSKDAGGTDVYGFNALYAGSGGGGSFYGGQAYFAVSDSGRFDQDLDAWGIRINTNLWESYGKSVRCLKD